MSKWRNAAERHGSGCEKSAYTRVQRNERAGTTVAITGEAIGIPPPPFVDGFVWISRKVDVDAVIVVEH